MSNKKKSAKKNKSVNTNANLENSKLEENQKNVLNENKETEQVEMAEQQSEQTENTPKKVQKEKVVEVKAKDLAKTKKKEKNKKSNKVAKALKDTGNELKRISWPPFKQVVKQTSIVLVFVIVFTVVLFGFDQLCIWLTSFLY